LMFIDNFDQSLKFIVRDASGFPDKLYNVSLSDNYKSIIEFNNSKLLKTFFCFSLDKRIIESVEVNFSNYTFRHDYFYTEGPIEDLVIQPDEAGNAELFILYSKDRNLNYEIYSKTSLKYSNRIYDAISYNWFSPSIISTKEMLIGYWSTDNGFENFNLIDLKGSKYETKQLKKIKSGDFSIVSESNISSNSKDHSFISLISGKNGISMLIGNNNFNIYSQLNSKYGFRITNKNQLFFDKTNAIFVNASKDRSVYKLFPVQEKNQLKITKIFEDIDISNFIVTNLDQRNYQIIYTYNNLISIRKLPK